MSRTHQKPTDPGLSKGAHGKRKICTIHPKGQQRDALTFQEKLDILSKMQEMGEKVEDVAPKPPASCQEIFKAIQLLGDLSVEHYRDPGFDQLAKALNVVSSTL
jgi:hypothetical protein